MEVSPTDLISDGSQYVESYFDYSCSDVGTTQVLIIPDRPNNIVCLSRSVPPPYRAFVTQKPLDWFWATAPPLREAA